MVSVDITCIWELFGALTRQSYTLRCLSDACQSLNGMLAFKTLNPDFRSLFDLLILQYQQLQMNMQGSSEILTVQDILQRSLFRLIMSNVAMI